MSDPDYYRVVSTAENCGVYYNRYMKPTKEHSMALRSYPCSPDQICVQLRGTKHYMSANLRVDIAEEFAHAILRAVQERKAFADRMA